jgi:ankyrin repeat protein
MTALLIAACLGYGEIVQLLISAGADIHLKSQVSINHQQIQLL